MQAHSTEEMVLQLHFQWHPDPELLLLLISRLPQGVQVYPKAAGVNGEKVSCLSSGQRAQELPATYRNLLSTRTPGPSC